MALKEPADFCEQVEKRSASETFASPIDVVDSAPPTMASREIWKAPCKKGAIKSRVVTDQDIGPSEALIDRPIVERLPC